jgi:hypothetical protein
LAVDLLSFGSGFPNFFETWCCVGAPEPKQVGQFDQLDLLLRVIAYNSDPI